MSRTWMQKIMSATPGSQRRRKETQNEAQVKEMASKVAMCLAANCLPWSAFDIGLRALTMPVEACGRGLEVETLAIVGQELCHDYQNEIHRAITSGFHQCSAVVHEWLPPNASVPIVLIAGYFVDSAYQMVEVPLGVFGSEQDDDILLCLLRHNVNRVTYNGRLSQKVIDGITYGANSEKISAAVLPCFVEKTVEAVAKMLIQLCETENWTRTIQGSTLSELVFHLLGPYHIEVCKGCEVSRTIEMVKHTELPESIAGPVQWAMTIIEPLDRIHQCLLLSSAAGDPTIHMATKWAKSLLYRYKKASSNPRATHLEPFVLALERYLKDHLMGLSLATYLHPSTSRYLQLAELDEIRRWVDIQESASSVDGDVSTGSDNEASVLNMFDCAGKNTQECYLYESTAAGSLASGGPNLTKEAGPDLLRYWQANQRVLPTLAQAARAVLATQPSAQSSRLITEFKRCYRSEGDLATAFFLFGKAHGRFGKR
ncbi:hypothetical protein DICA2_D15918 [Diutina catenulata]